MPLWLLCTSTIGFNNPACQVIRRCCSRLLHQPPRSDVSLSLFLYVFETPWWIFQDRRLRDSRTKRQLHPRIRLLSIGALLRAPIIPASIDTTIHASSARILPFTALKLRSRPARLARRSLSIRRPSWLAQAMWQPRHLK